MSKTQYVIGFLFRDSDVALISKNRPDWQKGKFNGVGGHIEDGESPADAMQREFYEEAGGWLESWEYYCTMVYPDAAVHCFRSFEPYSPISKTDELITWHSIYDLPVNVIPNLHWLIPLAMNDDDYLIKVICNPTPG